MRLMGVLSASSLTNILAPMVHNYAAQSFTQISFDTHSVNFALTIIHVKIAVRYSE